MSYYELPPQEQCDDCGFAFPCICDPCRCGQVNCPECNGRDPVEWEEIEQSE